LESPEEKGGNKYIFAGQRERKRDNDAHEPLTVISSSKGGREKGTHSDRFMVTEGGESRRSAGPRPQKRGVDVFGGWHLSSQRRKREKGIGSVGFGKEEKGRGSLLIAP